MRKHKGYNGADLISTISHYFAVVSIFGCLYAVGHFIAKFW